jgi:hypothetical protein
MKADDDALPSERFNKIHAILHDCDNKYSRDDFQEALDYIVQVQKPDFPGASELKGGEAGKLYDEVKKALHEKKQLLALLLEHRRELTEKMSPGRKFSNLAMLVLGEKRFHRYVVPAMADMHMEYFAALKAGEYKKARFIVWRFYVLILWPLVRIFVATIKTIFDFAHR